MKKMIRLFLGMSSLMLTLAVAHAEKEAPKAPTEEKKEAAESQMPRVVLKTTAGDITLELNSEKAPISTKNFLKYVEDKFYDETIFHRVIPNFMVQGGGFTTEMEKKNTKAPIKNEASNGLSNVVGSVAMARTNNPDSATAQFFINVKDNDFLNYSSRNPGYAVFGKVVEGMDIVMKMSKTETGRSGRYSDVPKEQIIIKEAVLVK